MAASGEGQGTHAPGALMPIETARVLQQVVWATFHMA